MKHMFFVVAVCILFVPAMGVSYSGSFGVSDIQFSIGERGYDSVRMNGLENIKVVGAPQVPVKLLNFIIPPGMDVDNISIVSNTQILSNAYNLIPVQPQIPTSDEWQPGPFVEPDSTYYTMSVYPPTSAEVLNYGYFDGNARIATIAIYPLQYMPQSKQIVLNSSIGFNLSFKASSQIAVYPTKRTSYLQEKYNALLSNIVENPEDIQMYYSQPPSIGLLPTEADYVIVAPAELISCFNDFVSWKAAKGLHIYTKSIEEIIAQYPNGDQVVPGCIGIDDDAGSIRQYLFDQYSQHGLVYALLVGDDTIFPIRYGYGATDYPSIPADIYFAEFGSKWNVDNDNIYGEEWEFLDRISEIFVGRLLVPSLSGGAAQFISNWFEKIVTYETNPGYGDYSYLTKSFYSVADQMAADLETHNILLSQVNLLEANGFQTTVIEENPPNGPLGTPTGTEVVNEVKNGYGLQSFYGHGNVTRVAVATTNYNTSGGPKYGLFSSEEDEDSDYVNEIGNSFDSFLQDGRYSVNYSMSCDTAAYDEESSFQGGDRNCMARAFTTILDKKGGPVYLGNTRAGLVYGSTVMHKKFLDVLFHTQSVYGQYNCTNVGIPEAASKILYYDKFLWFSHNLFGDPEMPIWTEQPKQIVLSYSTQNNSIHVVNAETNVAIPNAMVHFWNASSSQSELRVTDSNGNAVCSFPYTDVSVTKVNHIPLLKHIVPTGGEVWATNQDLKYDVIVPAGRSLTILDDVNLSMLSKNRNARIIIEDGASLYIDNATITGKATSYDQIKGNAIIVYGDLTIGDNVVFSSVGGLNWDGLYIDNQANSTINNATFNRCNLKKLNGDIVVNGSTFINAEFISSDATVSINNSNFTGSIDISNSNETSLTGVTVNSLYRNSPAIKIYNTPQLQIENVNVSGAGDGIEMQSCRDYSINNSSFSNNSGNGISIYETNGMYGYAISDCEITDNAGVGVRFYNSIGNLTGCMIANNNKGVTAYRVSNVTIGNTPDNEDSYIGNNELQEILFVDSANLFIDGERNMVVDNAYDPITFDKYLIQCPNLQSSRPMRLNFWGYRNQHDIAIMPPESRFYPECIGPDAGEIGYYLDPVWDPGIPRTIDQDNDAIIFYSAIDAALDENPTLAISLFKQLISEFPGSEFAAASAKHIYALENDKLTLKDYYLSEPNLHYNGEIDKIIDYLTTHCNIKLGNYQEAIAWFEDVISNPPSELDSLMAVIDLGYVYMLMEGDDKASVIAMYPQLKPKSLLEFEANRESILSNLYTSVENPYGNGSNTSSIVAVVPVLERNFPNPFNPSTTLSFSLPSEMVCKLEIYNIRGQKVKTLLNESLQSGRHSIVWDGKNAHGRSVSSGVYFYRLDTPNMTQTSKMLLMK